MIFIQIDKSTWAVPPALNMRDPSVLNATASTDPFILRLSTHCFVCKDEANRKIINIYVSPGETPWYSIDSNIFQDDKIAIKCKNYRYN